MTPGQGKRGRGRACVAVLGLLLSAAACAPNEAGSGRIDAQAAANCAPLEYDQAAYDSCIAEEKRRLNAAAINTLSNVTGQTLLTVPMAGGALHH